MTEFFICLVEGYEEPMPMVGPFESYDAAIEAHYEHAINEWPEEEREELRQPSAHKFYLEDDAVRIAVLHRKEDH